MRRMAPMLCVMFAVTCAADGTEVAPEASLRSLAMDPLHMYDDYEALWSRAAPASGADVAQWKELVASVDADTPDGAETKCGYRVWTAKNDKPWREDHGRCQSGWADRVHRPSVVRAVFGRWRDKDRPVPPPASLQRRGVRGITGCEIPRDGNGGQGSPGPHRARQDHLLVFGLDLLGSASPRRSVKYVANLAEKHQEL